MGSILAFMLLLSGCRALPEAVPPAAQPASPVEQAAREATAIVASAKATAIMLQAQEEARALVDEALRTPTGPAAEATAPSDPEETAEPEANDREDGSADDEDYRIEFFDIGYAGEGGFIMVRFHATRKAADDLWPGRISVTDEVTGTVYNEVPVMPVIGPLIGRPRSFEQLGYVMLTNTPPGLEPGATVTIQLGQFSQAHVQVPE